MNWFTGCEECRQINDEYWAGMWKDLYCNMANDITIKEFWAFLNSSWSYNGKTATQYCDTIGKVIWLTRNKRGKITVMAGGQGNSKSGIIANVNVVEEAIVPLAGWIRERPRFKLPDECIKRYAERNAEMLKSPSGRTVCRFIKYGTKIKWVHGICSDKLPSKPIFVEWLE